MIDTHRRTLTRGVPVTFFTVHTREGRRALDERARTHARTHTYTHTRAHTRTLHFGELARELYRADRRSTAAMSDGLTRETR